MNYRNDHPAIAWRNLIAKTPMSPTARAVASILAQMLDRDARCFPSQQTLADLLQRTTRTIRTALTELKTLGLVRIIRRGLNLVNHYAALFRGKAPREAAQTPDRKPASAQERKPASTEQGFELEKNPLTPFKGEKHQSTRQRTLAEDLRDTSWAT